MPAVGDTRIHETDFCAQVAAFATAIFESNPSLPFQNARIEGFGSRTQSLKRKDLRFYNRSGQVALCGETKLPGTLEGRSPYDDKLVRDAHQKADDAGVRYFFTWNVNTFVLWDRQRWDVPLLDRRIHEWRLDLNLSRPEDVGRADVLDHIKAKFLPNLLADIAEIYTERQPDWGMPPDDIFIRSLESHLDWPVQLTRDWLTKEAERNRSFDSRLQEWMASQDWTFVRKDPEEWRNALDRASRSLAYILVNRLIFYKALRDKFGDLPVLRLVGSVQTANAAYTTLQNLFERAVRRSGDYEPLFYPHEKDWASRLVFEAPGALDAWRGVLRGIENYDFKSISSDVVGRIFQRLISPEERHRFGQHFTGDDVVDLINAFCIRNADANVLDPACGSGSFLVRAYYRKKTQKARKTHQELIAELFGCDIAIYPAHLATLNLAAREINEEANYPRIARKDFFDVKATGPFCKIPVGSDGEEIPIRLPELDVIVGNPPYVEQTKIPKKYKTHLQKMTESSWPSLRLSGRSDLHCYFWPVATRLLRPDGYFGFLTSSSWLDAEYGFQLQAWLLQNFKILAILESAAEPWFPDARVKTCATILQRCDDEAARMSNKVRFVCFKKPLADLIGVVPSGDETARQRAVERLRNGIEAAGDDHADDNLRVILKKQEDLWDDGVRASQILRDVPVIQTEDDDEDSEESDDAAIVLGGRGDYAAGKWGRYVRAPDFYFEIMREFGNKFVALGEIADIRRGITSGCDAFFMPHEVTAWALEECKSAGTFKRRFGVERELVTRGDVKIIKAGDGSIHPIEATYLAPEVHSLMDIDRPIIRASQLDRLVLLISDSPEQLRGTLVGRYLRYGETHPFASRKSKAVPVPKRSTCAARDPWYDLTRLIRPGFSFWAKSQQYRHIVPGNPEHLIGNCNLYDVSSNTLTALEKQVLAAVLNSTLVGLFKTFYGRFAGTEGNLKTEVVDVNLLEVPHPQGVNKKIAERLLQSFQSMTNRQVGRLVEEALMNCHSPERAKAIAQGAIALSEELGQADRYALDEAVFELLGVSEPNRRKSLVERLHIETALHFRHIRVVEIQKMEQRASATGGSKFRPDELATDAWDSLEDSDVVPVIKWLEDQTVPKTIVRIPQERPAYLASSQHMFDAQTVYFGKTKNVQVDCASRSHADLILLLATLDISGDVLIPTSEKGCEKVCLALESRLGKALSKFEALASSRTGDDRLQSDVVNLLMHWHVHGRPGEAEHSR